MLAFVTQHYKLALATGIIALLFAWMEWKYFWLKSKGISPVLAALFIERQHAAVWDLRPASDFLKAHIFNAQLMAYDQIMEFENTEDTKKPLILVATLEELNWEILTKVRQLGFTAIYHLEGGIENWQASHLPLVSQDTFST